MISHKRLSDWYLQLSQHLHAGVPLIASLRMAQGPSERGRNRLADAIEAGQSLPVAMQSAPNWLPKADRIFICAGHETGRLPQTLTTLSDHHTRIGSSQMKAILAILYPLGVLHLAALILPLVGMIDFEVGFTWNAHQHLTKSGILLLPTWVLIMALYLLAATENPLLPRIMRCLPILRRYSKAQALANFSYALGTFVETGVPIQTAWRHAARMSHDTKILSAAKKVDPIIENGGDPTPELKKYKVFPPELVAFYSAGSISGKLDQSLIAAGQRYQLKANHAMTAASIVYPALLFAGVAAFIIYSIFKVYGGYLQMLLDLAS